MESDGSVRNNDETQAVISESTEGKSTKMKLLDHVIFRCIPGKEEQTVHRPQHAQRRRILDFLRARRPSKDWLLKLTAPPPPGGGGRSFHFPLARRINWKVLLAYCKNWAKHPMNMALLVWLFFVAVGLVVLFLFMVGLLDGAVPERSQRKRWIEITNQILNALFTIMCIYQHPRLLHHLFFLSRWRSDDIAEMRKVYCKGNGDRVDPPPHEWFHMLLVVVLLHITCLSQYGLCALYWGYSLDARPSWPQVLLVVVGILAPVTAGVYVVHSPLGRRKQPEDDEIVPQGQIIEQVQGPSGGMAEPEWVGGLFDCSDDFTVGVLSFLCTFGVFGWNMERLGLGNMYVHIVTFLLLCVAPLLVFSVAAVRIDDDAVRYVMGAAGVVLCFCGLLYGGFWRTQMRKRFKLPANHVCCGRPGMADFVQWLFCWSCALAQEVRTGNLYGKARSGGVGEGSSKVQQELRPLQRESELGPVVGSKNSAKRGGVGDGLCCVRINVEEEASEDECRNKLMTPPLPLPPLDYATRRLKGDQVSDL